MENTNYEQIPDKYFILRYGANAEAAKSLYYDPRLKQLRIRELLSEIDNAILHGDGMTPKRICIIHALYNEQKQRFTQDKEYIIKLLNAI